MLSVHTGQSAINWDYARLPYHTKQKDNTQFRATSEPDHHTVPKIYLQVRKTPKLKSDWKEFILSIFFNKSHSCYAQMKLVAATIIKMNRLDQFWWPNFVEERCHNTLKVWKLKASYRVHTWLRLTRCRLLPTKYSLHDMHQRNSEIFATHIRDLAN